MNKSPEITIYSLDGLNSTGKSTQLQLLKHELAKQGIISAIRRGDGARKGTGDSEADPSSSWWVYNHPLIAAAGINGPESFRMATLASRRLMDELVQFSIKEFPDMMSKNSASRGVILLDRGPVSRMFVARRYQPNISFAEAMGIVENPIYTNVIPKRIAVLNTDIDTINARNATRHDGEAKKIFNNNLVNTRFDEFRSLLDNLPDDLKQITKVVDASPPPEITTEVLLYDLMEAMDS